MAQQLTFNELYPFAGRASTVGWDVISSLSSIFEPADNSGSLVIPWMFGSLSQLACILLPSDLSTSIKPPRSELEDESEPTREREKHELWVWVTPIDLVQNLH